MSKTDTHHRSGGHGDQRSAGLGSHNVNPAQELYDREFNDIISGMNDVRETGNRIVNDNADTVREKESTLPKSPQPVLTKKGAPAKIRQLFTSKKLRGKTSLITVALILFGGGGAVSIFASPSLAIVQLRQVLTQDLNDQLKAFENRHAYLTRAKIKTATNGSCGAIEISCRFATMSDKQVERYEKRGVTVERDMRGSILPGRGKITSFTIPQSDGKDPIKINSPQEFTNKMTNDPIVRAAMQKAENPWFASVTDKTFMTALRKLGTNKASRIQGSTNEEREKSVNSIIGESQEIDARNLTPERDSEGKETGRLIGPDGSVLTQKQIDDINESGKIMESAGKIKPGGVALGVAKGVMATGTLDMACTAYNASRMVGALANANAKKQAAQMTMATLLVPADKIMAGAASDGETEFVGNKINNIGGPQQPEQIIDESKLYEPGSDKAPPMKQNDAQYMTAFDSPGAKAALHGDVIPLDSRHAKFSLGGAFMGTLATMNEYIARLVNGGDPNPQEVSEKCKYIQNPYVRGTALLAGIFVGAATFGTYQSVGIAASLGLMMATPYILSVAADIVSGDMFKNLYGDEFGSGAFVGTSAIMGDAAQGRGLKPLSAEEAVAYTEATRQTLAQHAETERYLARSEPFNIYNQYSFLGSLATTLTPTLTQSRSSVGMMASSVMSLVPTTIATMTGGNVKAASTVERFQQCDDPGYKALGIDADIYCNVRYGLSEKELAIDPIENATWMAQTGNIAADDDSGTPLDNGQPWNYQNFMEECVNRTVKYGENMTENSGDGAKCLSAENESLNQRFRVFTLDLSVADYMDEIDQVASVESSERGEVSTDGWAYPTTKDAKISSGYKPADRPDHRGVDMYHDGGSLGKPIFAARDGKVVASGPASGFGNWIVIEHDVEGKKMSTVYGHMRAGDLLVRVGATVKAGQLISRIASEGQSTGPHLHFEIWNGNRLQCNGDCSINPKQILDKAKGSNPAPRRGSEVNI